MIHLYDLYTQVLEENPTHLEDRLFCWRYTILGKDFEKAYEHFESVSAQDTSYLSHLIESCTSANFDDRLLTTCNSLANAHTLPSALLIIAQLNFNRGDSEAALTPIEWILKKDPVHTTALLYCGMIYYRNRMCEEALEIFCSYIQNTPALAQSSIVSKRHVLVRPLMKEDVIRF